MDELKPCPFCGSLEIDMCGAAPYLNARGPMGFFLACHNCGAEGPTGSSKEETIEKWNGRQELNDAVSAFAIVIDRMADIME